MKRLLTLIIAIASVAVLTARVTAPSHAGKAEGRSAFSTRSYPLKDFTKLDVGNVVKVIYTQGDTYDVRLTGRTDWLDQMEVNATAGTLKVRAKHSKTFNNVKKKDQPDGQHNFILHLTAPSLQDISLSGVSLLVSKRLSSDRLTVRLQGVSAFKADAIECDQLNIHLSGSSKTEVGDIVCGHFKGDVSGASKADIEQLGAKNIRFSISGASKVNLPQASRCEHATFSVNGASKLNISAEVTGDISLTLSGASKGEVTLKGGHLRTVCTGASKLNAKVNCTGINANCDGASKTTFSGTADKVEIDRGGVAVNIDTSRLNQF